VVCDIGPAPEKVPVSTAVGIDLGLTKFLTLSDGSAIDNPRWERKHAARIAAANRALSRKQRRSKNRLRVREVLRRVHQRAADARLNYIHHVSKWLIQNYDLIAHEDLNIRAMAKSSFAKSIMDAAWGILLFQLKYKAESAGKLVVPVNPRGTSQRCSGCGETVLKALSNRQHSCPKCGLELGRDHNAALNILALGHSAVREIPAEISKEHMLIIPKSLLETRDAELCWYCNSLLNSNGDCPASPSNHGAGDNEDLPPEAYNPKGDN
jgi:putative transposase